MTYLYPLPKNRTLVWARKMINEAQMRRWKIMARVGEELETATIEHIAFIRQMNKRYGELA